MNVNILHIIFLVSAIIGFSSDAAITISNVVCQQQYPWNGKVNIEYEVYGGPEDTNIWVSATGHDKASVKEFSINALTGDGIDGPIKSGRHHMIWDAFKDYPILKVENFSITLQGVNSPRYMVVDLLSGAITYRGTEPSGGWSDEYKTTKMVLRFIQPGTFVMGSPTNEIGRNFNGASMKDSEGQHNVTISKPFYIGVFEVTQKQFELITGSNPSSFLGELRPVEYIKYFLIRGTNKGAHWPDNNDVDENSFFGILRDKTKKGFDLPTEAQWEYACRAGSTTAWNNGTIITNAVSDGNLSKLGRYGNNGGLDQEHAVVGSYAPNAWGLYDMHGNIYEWCLDWYEVDLGNESVIDPKGPSTGDLKVARGGCFLGGAHYCRSAARDYFYPSDTDNPLEMYSLIGFRVALGL